jgi:hypothetical protein
MNPPHRLTPREARHGEARYREDLLTNQPSEQTGLDIALHGTKRGLERYRLDRNARTGDWRLNPFLTSKEWIVIRLLFEWLGESPANRTLAEYSAIARRVPKLLAIHAFVNQRLAEIADANEAPYLISHFRHRGPIPTVC